MPVRVFPPPNDDLNCDINISYTSNNGAINTATAHPEYEYGAGVDPTRLYTVTIRVRGVFEMANYADVDGNSAQPLVYTGHVDPNQPYIFVMDVINPPVGGGPGAGGSWTGGGENEYYFEVIDPDTGNSYIYFLNNAHAGLATSQIQAVEYSFKIQVKKGWGVNLLGTSVDNKEFPNPPTPGGTPIEVHNEPIAIKVTQPYPGQFMQFDVIAINYTP
jgi:hypothetical protein